MGDAADNLEQIVKLCGKLGASPQQADTMARQLVKRAEQMAVERGITEVEAMEYLLKVLIRGRDGDVYLDPNPGKG